MKKQLLFTVLAGSFATLIFSSHAIGPYNGGAGNHTGSNGSPANCSTGSNCHASNNTNTTATLMLFRRLMIRLLMGSIFRTPNTR